MQCIGLPFHVFIPTWQHKLFYHFWIMATAICHRRHIPCYINDFLVQFSWMPYLIIINVQCNTGANMNIRTILIREVSQRNTILISLFIMKWHPMSMRLSKEKKTKDGTENGRINWLRARTRSGRIYIKCSCDEGDCHASVRTGSQWHTFLRRSNYESSR